MAHPGKLLCLSGSCAVQTMMSMGAACSPARVIDITSKLVECLHT